MLLSVAYSIIGNMNPNISNSTNENSMATTNLIQHEEAVDRGTSQPSMQAQQRRQHSLSKPYAAYSTYQKVQILRYRLKFLEDCRTLKRPPPSLRIGGANIMKDEVKLPKFSYLETEFLEAAIKIKRAEIKTMEGTYNGEKIPLSQRDCTILEKRFAKKIAFYKKQNKTKWTNWPEKQGNKKDQNRLQRKKLRNYKTKLKRRKRKTENDAQKALDSGSVVILINESVPKGTISVLGKGLGFIPTAKRNIDEQRG